MKYYVYCQVNNAGVSFNDIGENSVEHAEIVIKTNFYGSKWLTEALLPMFRRSDSAGRILNISSRLGLLNVSQHRTSLIFMYITTLDKKFYF